MTSAINPPELTPPLPDTLPDRTQLPESDGTFANNFQEHPQSILLTDSITPILQQLHADGQYCIGQDCGIEGRMTDPLLARGRSTRLVLRAKCTADAE